MSKLAADLCICLVAKDRIRTVLFQHNIGMALKADQISAQQAIDLVEEIAPGTLGFLSPLTGLARPRKSDAGTDSEAVALEHRRSQL